MLNNASKSSVSSTNMAQRLLVMPSMSAAQPGIAGNSAPSQRRPGRPDCQILRPQAPATATSATDAGAANPLAAREIPQPRQSQTAGFAATLVQAARHRTAQRLRHRPHHRPRLKQNAPHPHQTECPRPPQTAQTQTQTQTQNPQGQRLQTSAA